MTEPKIHTISVGGQDGFGGLYNAIFGDGNEIHRVTLVAILTGMQHRDFGRSRDAWVERTNTGARLALYTRNGGNNRPDYAEQIEKMQANPLYLFDKDDTFDNTYATFYFAVPERLPEDAPEAQQKEWIEVLRPDMVREAVEPVDMDELWQEGIKKMDDPEFAQALLEKTGLGDQLKAVFADPTPEEGTS